MNSDAQSSDLARYSSLRDYLHAIRRHRVLIVLVTLAFGAAAFLLSIAQEPDYEASASVQFRDVLDDFRLVAPGDPVPEIPAGIRAAQNAELLDRTSVSRRVRQRLDTELTIGQLENRVTGRVGTLTNLVIIEATAQSPDLAADIANAYAAEVRDRGIRDARRDIATARESVNAQLEAAMKTRIQDPTASFEVSSLRVQASRLASLKQLARPVEIVESARPPENPVSPKTTQNVVLGVIVGLFFGLIAAFFRDSLDRRLHTVQEVHEEIALPILGRVPDTAFGHPGLARNGDRKMSEFDFEAFRILRMNLGAIANGKPMRSVVVTSGLPEEGKSTVSMSLASAAAVTGQSVLLIECDLRRPSFESRLGIKRQPGLSDFLNGTASPKDILQVVDLYPPVRFAANGEVPADEKLGSLVCIAAGSPITNAAEILVGHRFEQFLDKVTRAYDLVVIDTSPLLAVVDPLQLIPQVDGVLVCVRLQRATREELRLTKSALENLPEANIGVVATGLRKGGADSAEYYYYGD
jgi:capsular exopolysaccharide synthesis family protein